MNYLLTFNKNEFIHFVNVFFWICNRSSCRAFIRPCSNLSTSSRCVILLWIAGPPLNLSIRLGGYSLYTGVFCVPWDAARWLAPGSYCAPKNKNWNKYHKYTTCQPLKKFTSYYNIIISKLSFYVNIYLPKNLWNTQLE